MTGAQLRRLLNRLNRSYTDLAPLLGLSISGLHKQMRGERPVTSQTELLLQRLEEDQAAAFSPSSRPSAAKPTKLKRSRRIRG